MEPEELLRLFYLLRFESIEPWDSSEVVMFEFELLAPELLPLELLEDEPSPEDEERSLELLEAEDCRLFLPG